MIRLMVFLLIGAGLGSFGTLVLNYFFSSRKYVKYLPSGLAFLLAAYNYILGRQHQGEGFRDLAFLIMAMLFLAAAVGGILTAVILERRPKR